MLKLILGYQFKSLVRFFRTRTAAKVITASLFVFLFLTIAAAVYYFFYQGILFISADHYFGQALLFLVYEMYLLILLFLVAMSTMINGLFRFFKSENDDWLMSSPRGDVLPKYVWLHSFWQAVWPFMVIGLPLVFALYYSLGLSGVGLAVNVVSAALLTVIVATAALIVLVFLAWLIDRARRYFAFIHLNIRTLAIGVFIFISLLLLFLLMGGLRNDLVQMLEAQNLEQSQAGISRITDNFRYLPSHLFASTLYYWQSGNSVLMFVYHVQLWLWAIILTAVWWLIAPGLGGVWSAFKTSFNPRESLKTTPNIRAKKAAVFNGGLYHALVKKEALVFVRDARGLFWFAFLLFFWLIQTVINLGLSSNISRYDLVIGPAPVIIQVMQLLTASYFIAAFALRFVFPAFSQERKTVWILSSAPIDWKKVFYAKLLFYNLLFVFLGLFIAYVNLSALALPFLAGAETLLVFSAVTVFIVTLSLSLGMIFPSFETDDPSALGTSLPGLALIFISLVFGALSAWAVYLKLTGVSAVFYYGLWPAVLIIVFALVLFAPRRYAKLDKVKLTA